MDAAVQREELNRCMDGLPEVCRWRNYCSNALSVEERVQIRRDLGACAHRRVASVQRKFQSGMNPDFQGRAHLFIYFMVLE